MMSDLFLNLWLNSILFWVIKIITLPLVLFILYYIFTHIMVAWFKPKDEIEVFPLHFGFSKLRAILIVTALWIFYFGVVIRFNGTDGFNFGSFDFNLRRNVYFALLPVVILPVTVIAIIYYSILSNLKKSI